MKFLLAVSVNHQELKEKIVDHLADIGDQFKIMDGYIRLFPEADMVEQVAGVYDNFIKFLQLSIDWCRENVFGEVPLQDRLIVLIYSTPVKFFKNVALPYQARIKPTIDELNKYSKRVKDRVDVNNTYRLAVMQNDISALITSLDDTKRLQISSHTTIAQLLRAIAQEQTKKEDVGKVQSSGDSQPKSQKRLTYSAPLSLDEPMQALPDHQPPLEHLKQCAVQSLQLEVDNSYNALALQDKPEVKSWLKSRESTLLWIDGFAHARASKWTTEFSVDVMLKAKEQGSIVLFYFADIAAETYGDPSATYFALTKTIINSFVAQLLLQYPSLVQAQRDWLTAQRWAHARDSTKGAWAVLQHLLHSLANKRGILYIMLDSIDALDADNSRSNNLAALLRRMSALVTLSPARGSGLSGSRLALKILITTTSGTKHTVLFPSTASCGPHSHTLIRVPQTFGQHNIPRVPAHQHKPRLKRLVRLPDSDEEFGFKAADSFEFSDEEGSEDMAFSSDEEVNNESPKHDSHLVLRTHLSLRTSRSWISVTKKLLAEQRIRRMLKTSNFRHRTMKDKPVLSIASS
ncbi:uncharacterized protein KY384_006516 [Bacidia gigantensis]|uniref:uncharacterized protein n=1 Tax=Bacidia gigantensis TaxID=2732470 RepID=UPI001D04DD5C|nr:uncharacterized protein KY384_006516 [Bacidia gigantensis]KAG8528827.1 hypothetical protein KY384_006516 [Bacidia gigantensis]